MATTIYRIRVSKAKKYGGIFCGSKKEDSVFENNCIERDKFSTLAALPARQGSGIS